VGDAVERVELRPRRRLAVLGRLVVAAFGLVSAASSGGGVFPLLNSELPSVSAANSSPFFSLS
jgi:hypothetical protein